MNVNEFHQQAQQSYGAHFGPDSENMQRHLAFLEAEEHSDWEAADELRQQEVEGVLAVEQLAHSFRGNCSWEILLSTGGPATRVRVEVDCDGNVASAEFQYNDWFQPWYAPENQDHCMLTDWAGANFYLECPYCAQEQGR